MNTKGFLLAAAAGLSLMPATAFTASDVDLEASCFAGVVSGMLLGNYAITTSPITVSVAGRGMIYEQWETGPGEIALNDANEFVLILKDGSDIFPEIVLAESESPEPMWERGSPGLPSTSIPSRSSPQAMALELLSEEAKKRMELLFGGLPQFNGFFRFSSESEANPSSREEGTAAVEDLFLGCELEELPELEGEFTTNAEGVFLEHQMRLTLVESGVMFGQWTWVTKSPQGNLDGFRTIFLRRN